MTTLPDKPSELIMLALEDIAAVERLPDDYVIDMGEWHTPDYDGSGKCAVCFAGSVMAMSADFDFNVDFADGMWSEEYKYYALNEFRRGDVSDALECMDLENHPGARLVPNRSIEASNYDDPCSFRRDMIKLASELAAVGL